MKPGINSFVWRQKMATFLPFFIFFICFFGALEVLGVLPHTAPPALRPKKTPARIALAAVILVGGIVGMVTVLQFT